MNRHVFNRLLILALFFSGPAFAQGTFAPVGAEWWYYNVVVPGIFPPPQGPPGTATSGEYSYHARSVADTVNGIACRRVTTDFRIKWNGMPPTLGFGYGPVKDFYFYDNTDTVFIYNEYFGRFTPMYVYNAAEGDTICLPVLPAPDPDLRINPLSGDSSFCFIIDSIRVLTYDTRTSGHFTPGPFISSKAAIYCQATRLITGAPATPRVPEHM